MGSSPAPGSDALRELIDQLPDELRREALTHATWSLDRSYSYERLAFLGDSVLGLSVAREVFRRFPEVTSGRLSQIANQTVSGVSCAAVGAELGVPDLLRANEPEGPVDRIPAETLLASGRPLPEVTEALIGACFLHYGLDITAPAVVAAFEQRLALSTDTMLDFKSALQERLARRGAKVSYRVTGESGPPHKRSFDVTAIVGDEEVGSGSGRSKKAAEQMAAEQALKRFGG